jgi:predicted metalloendopeptidase
MSNITTGISDRLQTLDWMSESTKAAAARKGKSHFPNSPYCW